MGQGATCCAEVQYAPPDVVARQADAIVARVALPDKAVISEPSSARLPPPRNFHDEYVLSKKLGMGAFATVYLVQSAAADAIRPGAAHLASQQFATKVLDLRPKGSGSSFCTADPMRQQAAQREINLANAASGSKHVVRFVEAFTEGAVSYLVMEKCDNTLLFVLERISQVNELSYKRIFEEMLKGVKAVHDVKVVHRDLKPDNFMCSGADSTVKLCDFGLAATGTASGGCNLSGIYGTPPFMAPEMLWQKPYGEMVDTWAFGVTAYVLLFGRFPYRGAQQTGQAMKAAIRTGTPTPSFQNGCGNAAVSDRAAGLVRDLLAREPEKRLTAAQALQSAFFTKGVQDTKFTYGSLRQCLHSAKRCGAFELREGGGKTKKEALSVDDYLTALQERHHHLQSRASQSSTVSERVIRKGSASLPSDASTEVGSDE